MVLVVEKKFLETDWWKYATAIFLLHLLFWVLLGYKINPIFTFWKALQSGYVLLSMFLIACFLPFVAARLQFKRMFWFAFTGLLLGLVAYYALSLLGIGRLYSLLPFISFMQLYVSCFGLGLIVELGGYVFRKLSE